MRASITLLLLCWGLMGHGQSKAAIRAFEEGRAALAAAEPTKALIAFTKAVDLDSTYVEAYQYRVHCYYGLKARHLALADLDRLVRFAPQAYRFQAERGDLLHALGRVPEALEAHRQALATKDARIDSALFEVGYDLLVLGELDSALHYFRRTQAVQPAFREARSNEAFVLMTQGRYAESGAGYRTLIAEDPADAISLSNLSFVELRMGQLDSALVHVERAILLNEENAWAYRNRGLVHAAMGGSGPACRDLQQAEERGFERRWGAAYLEELRAYCRPQR